jgi:RNA polymerase sigma-70 factor (ECF subfamily)
MSVPAHDARSQDGPRSAGGPDVRIETYFREYARELWAIFYAHCCDSERAWDAVQHAFLKLQEQNGTEIHDPRAWLLQVGKNWLRDVARAREHAWRAPQRDDWTDLADRREDPAGSASRTDLLAKVRHLMSELRMEDREVLVLRYGLGWPSARIAETLDCSVQAIDMRLSRARQRLAALLAAADIHPDCLD